MSTFGFVGDLLRRGGVVDDADLARAAALQSERGISIARAVVELGLADESTVAATIAAALSLEYVSGVPPAVDDAVRALLPGEFCRRYDVVPLAVSSTGLRVAMADPLAYSVVQDIEFRTGKRVVAVVATPSWVSQVLDRIYPVVHRAVAFDLLESVTPAGEVEPAKELEYDLVDPATLVKDTRMPPIVRLVNAILSDAAKSGASDVHIEPTETGVLVRQRVDGLLRETLSLPRHLQDQTVSRLKIISGMDIAERRRPQDGRCRLRFGGRRIDLRVSTLPTQFGEKVVIRLLAAERAIASIDDLAMAPEALARLKSMLARPQGLLLVTGPTGSGKTSTLYSAINSIKSPTTNIITLEDPIEIQVPGVNQTQVNVRAGVTFAAGLRSVLRQDPDVILVGEIRDQETASISLEAAQTGHLLLSTLHTNDAAAAITRLLDLGIQPFLVAASLAGVIAQRLVRQPCPACSAPRPPSPETLAKLAGVALPDGAWVGGQGCSECGQSGFKGRIAIHELLDVDERIRELITGRAAEHLIRRAARSAGMRTLLEDGIDKAARGLTTLDEVLRVVAVGDARGVAGNDRSAETVATREASAPEAPPAPIQRRRVLVVEDSATIVTIVKYYLELEGLEVVAAEDGRLGLQMALQECPGLIVSDVNMPGMGGVEMVKALRLHTLTADVPVLMLTSESSVEKETEGLAAGADDYLAKPVDPKRLVARVKALLARSGTPRT